MGGGDKKITRNSEYGKGSYQNPRNTNLERQATNYFKQQFEVEPEENQSQEQEVDSTVFCSTCGAPQDPPFENHQPSIASIEERFKTHDLIISTNLQDDKSLFVALLEESTPKANELEQNILSHKLVSDVAMVDGGLIIETFMKSVECDECGETSVIERERSDEYRAVQPYHQTVQNKVELLKQMADDEVVERFQRIVEGGEIDTDTVKQREMLKGQREKFSDDISSESVDLETLYPNVAEESDDGSLSQDNDFLSLNIDELQIKGFPSLNTDELQIRRGDGSSDMNYTVQGDFSSSNIEEIKNQLEKHGYGVYTPDNDDS